MKGIVRKAVASACLGGVAATLTGCAWYRDTVDPCYPERYNAEARRVTHQVFDAQAHNGHVLDQTVWNHHFERDDKGAATDKLSVGGQQKLNYLIRRRPAPDAKVYLQTANDIGGDVEKLAAVRQELDARRAQAIQRYLAAQSVGRTHQVGWDVAVHDAPEVGMDSLSAGGVTGPVNITGYFPRYQGSFTGAGTAGQAGMTGGGQGGVTVGGNANSGASGGGSSSAPSQPQ